MSILGLIAAAGCGPSGSSANSAPATAASTGAFHHFIYNPYKAGSLHGVAATGAAVSGALAVPDQVPSDGRLTSG